MKLIFSAFGINHSHSNSPTQQNVSGSKIKNISYARAYKKYYNMYREILQRLTKRRWKNPSGNDSGCRTMN